MSALDAAAVTRVILDLLDEKIGGPRGRSLRDEPGFDAQDPGALSLGDDGAGLDSLEMLTAAGLVNEFFRVHEAGIEDVFLRKRRLAEWAELVTHALAEGLSGITFQTSGTTGMAKRVGHSWEALEQEITYLSRLFERRSRIIATVPAHHIYGFLFTVLLPSRLGLPVEIVRWDRLGSLGRSLRPGDLLVAQPTIWRYLSRVVASWPTSVWGTSSTAPLPAPIHRTVREAGLERLTEVYGSTETAGVGVREEPEAPFELFPYLSRDRRGRDGSDGGLLLRELPDGTRQDQMLRDHLEWQDERRFYPRGRLDRVVQVGGENVDLAHVEDVLASMPGIVRAIVRPTAADGEPRLKAFLVAREDPDTVPTTEAIDIFAREKLRGVERPISITVGNTPPTNALGKVVDWDPA